MHTTRQHRHENRDDCKQGELSRLDEKGAAGKEEMHQSPRGEKHHNRETFGHGEDGDVGEDGDEEEDEEPSVLEKILPRFPASRKEVFVRVEGVFGLLPPFSARGGTVSGRVFWGGREVRSRLETLQRQLIFCSASSRPWFNTKQYSV